MRRVYFSTSTAFYQMQQSHVLYCITLSINGRLYGMIFVYCALMEGCQTAKYSYICVFQIQTHPTPSTPIFFEFPYRVCVNVESKCGGGGVWMCHQRLVGTWSCNGISISDARVHNLDQCQCEKRVAYNRVKLSIWQALDLLNHPKILHTIP